MSALGTWLILSLKDLCLVGWGCDKATPVRQVSPSSVICLFFLFFSQLVSFGRTGGGLVRPCHWLGCCHPLVNTGSGGVLVRPLIVVVTVCVFCRGGILVRSYDWGLKVHELRVMVRWSTVQYEWGSLVRPSECICEDLVRPSECML